jgi:hypothetical protein
VYASPSMRPSPLLALAAALLAAACAPAVRPVAAPVTLIVPGPGPVASIAEVASPEPPPKPARRERVITGEWKEEFKSRGGCSDAMTIHGTRGALTIRGADCHDNAAYEFSGVKYDGENLSLDLRVPETGYVVHYKLRWVADEVLGGEAAVTGSGKTDTYEVTWTRARETSSR